MKKKDNVITVMVDPEAIMKRRRNKSGRPRISDEIRNEVVRDYNDGILSIKQIATKHGISDHTLYNILSERGYHEALGKAKSRDTVANT